MSALSPSQHVKRPRNAWVIFRQVKSKEYKEAHPEEKLDLPDMSKTISGEWAKASQEVKQYYQQLANQEHQNLLAIHPDYKYQPRKKRSGGKLKKTSTVKEGGVTKPRAAKKKTVSTTTTDIAPTHPTDVHGVEWLEANVLAPFSNNFGELGLAVAPNDQYAVIGSNHTFYDTIFSHDALDVTRPDHAAQLMAYSGQLSAGPSPTAMQPFVTFQLDAYQSGGQMAEGYTAAYDNQPHTGDGSYQLFNIYGDNIFYEQATELDTSAGPSETYTTAYSQDEGYSGYSSQDIINVDANSLQDLNDFWGCNQEFQYGWAESAASARLVGI